MTALTVWLAAWLATFIYAAAVACDTALARGAAPAYVLVAVAAWAYIQINAREGR